MSDSGYSLDRCRLRLHGVDWSIGNWRRTHIGSDTVDYEVRAGLVFCEVYVDTLDVDGELNRVLAYSGYLDLRAGEEAVVSL